MSVKWLSQLQLHYPHLAQKAIEINQIDGFVMYEKEQEKSLKKSKKKKSNNDDK
jgi:hypothetical protein